MWALCPVISSSRIWSLFLLLAIWSFTASEARRFKRKAIDVECQEIGKYYRNPDVSKQNCYTYYYCLGGTVFEYSCSGGLMFDIRQQICNFEDQVKNCNTTAEATSPRPRLNTIEPICPPGQLACNGGQCIDKGQFCDGNNDCGDYSDEVVCGFNEDPNLVATCNKTACQLPDCFCSTGGATPPIRDVSTIPQMIVITFDDAINVQNIDLYNSIFSPNRTNKNGCPIRGTFFVSHEYSNYQYVEKMWKDGHEVASHSITHRQPEKWWSNASKDEYTAEFEGQRSILSQFANIPMSEVKGLRVPFLRPGWNAQFDMMTESGFLYDASLVAPPSTPPLWPYTLDYRMPHKCIGYEQKCPTRSHPGVWEMVMNQLLTKSGYYCSMIDNCPEETNQDRMKDFFMDNFKRFYETNRAPFGLYFHTLWFDSKSHTEAFMKFIDEALAMPDVWVVTEWQVVEWMRDPTSLQNIAQFKPWQCNDPTDIRKMVDPVCQIPNYCHLMSPEIKGDRYMATCNACPSQYPYLKNPSGQDV
ncbi:hypothetical protein RvY_12649 [Ramazzottius varieornatus]|uniref:Chitin-binding type-2 domain-containing protein n=1 Tax=Ramazzottius varieornatus TaxID=947166 RepID=A0A1D1VMH4_RAMVA|nr:hypothetical protein RvY_12649 [Ramazzottius varieornatus]